MRNSSGNAAIFFILLIGGTLFFAVSEALKGRSITDLFLIRPAPPLYESPRPEPVVRFESLPPAAPSSGPKKPAVTPPKGFTAEELSPFYEEVRINSFNPARSSGDKGTLSLVTVSFASPVSVTGWTVRGRTRQAVTVPQAVSDYGLFSSPLEDIVLKPSGVLYVFGGTTGFGTNVRLNDCMGYFNDVYVFQPRLPVSCPRPFESEEIIDFSGKCQDFMRSLGSCEVPSAQKLFAFKENDPACISFMGERIGYSQCYKRHRNDSRFFSDTWYTWLGREMPFDPLHDRLFLFDREGLLVDEYVY